MDKDDILAKSRKEQRDEGMLLAEDKGRKIGVSVFCFVFIFIILVNMLNGQPNYAPNAMFWAFLAADALPKYQFTKNKAYLVTVIAGFIASLAFLISFVIQAIGV